MQSCAGVSLDRDLLGADLRRQHPGQPSCWTSAQWGQRTSGEPLHGALCTGLWVPWVGHPAGRTGSSWGRRWMGPREALRE